MVEIKQKPPLDARWLDPQAVEIVRRLQKAGFTSYLVGGCIRDILAGIPPKDFDIATSAVPNIVKKKVWGSYVIGRRFRLVLVKRNEQQYEVATFRREPLPEEIEAADEETPIGENFFGTPEQDALRRDFTINALFYDPIKEELIDYAEALPDINQRILRMIGNPVQRIVEDPIRSLRAIRFSHKLGFKMETSLREAIQSHASAVAQTVLPRRREEYLKILRLKEPVRAFCELYDLGLMEHLLPTLSSVFNNLTQREIFCQYMLQGSTLVEKPNEPIENYLPFIFAFIKSFEHTPDFANKLDLFMRMELGVFKSEQTEILHVIEMSSRMPSIQAFKKRGSRRQASFLSQPGLPKALKIARMDYVMNPTEQTFWEGALQFSREL